MSYAFSPDSDAAHGVLSITKARVLGIDKDVTKTGEDRRIRLCRRAITVIGNPLVDVPR